MELRHLRCFLAVGDELSFARAAEKLHFATSNVSQQITQLERELGVRLFDRSTRQVRLTPAGETLRASARRILTEVENFTTTARRNALGQSGTVHGSFCPGTGDMAGELVRAVTLQRPDIGLVFDTRSTAEVTHAVSTGESLVGISRLVGPGMRSLVVSSHPRSFLAMPEGHRLEKQPVISLRDLDGEDFVVVEPANTVFYDEIVTFFDGHGVRPVFQSFPIKSVEEAMELVAVRHGVNLVTHREVVHYPLRGVIMRPIAGRVPVTLHHLIWREDEHSPLVRYVVMTAERLVPILGNL